MATNLQEEYYRCYTDKTRKYFIENYLSTFDAEAGKKVAFRLFPRQIAFIEAIVSKEKSQTIAIKHRQAGITTVSAAWVTGQIVFASKMSPETVLCIGNKLDLAQQLLEKVADFLDQVPRWMWGSAYYSPEKDNPKNTKSIYKTRNKDKLELFNGCKVHARSSGENAARGISAATVVIFDEAAFIDKGISVYKQAYMTTASVKNSKIIMVSTPNGKDQLYYRTYVKALKGENNFVPVEFKWFQDPRYNRWLKWHRQDEETGEIKWIEEEVLNKNGDIRYDEERWRTLEKEGWIPESPWFEDACKGLNNDEQSIAQEILVSFIGSSDNVVPGDVIEAQLNQNVIQLPKNWNLRDPYVNETWIWEEPNPDHRYLLCVDPSSGSSEDRTAIEVLDIDAVDEKGKPYVNQVLEYYGKRTGDEIGEMVYRYGTTYNNALCVVECIGGYGDSVVLTLMNMKYPNIYFDDPGLKTYTVQKEYSKFGIKKDDKLPGFRTSSLRVQTIGNFVTMVKDNTFRIRSRRVIEEMETWVFKGGRADHMDGYHDDSLTCLAMGLFVMEFSMLKNIKNKKKDKKMLESWTSNNWMSSKTPQSKYEDFSISKTPHNNMMLFSTRSLEKERERAMAGMLMLGGFRNASRNG